MADLEHMPSSPERKFEIGTEINRKALAGEYDGILWSIGGSMYARPLSENARIGDARGLQSLVREILRSPPSSGKTGPCRAAATSDPGLKAGRYKDFVRRQKRHALHFNRVLNARGRHGLLALDNPIVRLALSGWWW